MKTSKNIISLGLILALSLSSLMAISNNTPKGNVPPSPEKSIANYFKFPSILIPYSETKANAAVKVEVIFTTDKLGKVTYAYAKTKDLKLKQEIERQFSTFKLPQIKENVAHSVMLNFQYVDGK
ncbi:MAG: hypothetical protein PSX36_05225 [bacterium]|nr:hypothetical protein [bacterium]